MLKWIKVTLKFLNDVKQEYLETKIEDRLEEECSKEKISVDEVIFLITYREAKSKLAQKKHFLFCSAKF